MGNALTIYRREMAAYFNSPIAYIFIVLFVLLLSFMFFMVNGFFSRPIPEIRSYYDLMPWFFAVFIPAITMRLWSEEKRAGTVELLLTTPMTTLQVVLGKYFAGLSVITVAIALTLFVPWSVSKVTDLDSGVVFATYIGAFLIAAVNIALGAWVSSWTQNQIVALLVSVTFCFLLALIGHTAVVNYLDSLSEGSWLRLSGSYLVWFGTFFHFDEFSKGVIKVDSIIYAISMTAFFLTLNHVFVEGRKY